MKVMRTIIQQAMWLCFLMTGVICVEELITYFSEGAFFDLSGYIPLSLLLVSFLASIPTFILYVELPGVLGRLRVGLHFLIVYAVVIASGHLFRWYQSTQGFLVMSVVIVIIYLLVWLFTSLMFQHEARAINAALSRVRDEE